jgi:hypothetical protein
MGIGSPGFGEENRKKILSISHRLSAIGQKPGDEGKYFFTFDPGVRHIQDTPWTIERVGPIDHMASGRTRTWYTVTTSIEMDPRGQSRHQVCRH